MNTSRTIFRLRTIRWLAFLPLLPAPAHGAADPQILFASPSSPATRLGNIVAVDFTVVNFGEMEATDTILKVTLPPDWEFVPSDPPDNRLTVIPGNPVCIECDLGTVQASDFPSCKIRAKANTTGAHQIQGMLSSPDDTNPANNNRDETFLIGPPADQFKNPNTQQDDGDPIGTFAGNFHLTEPPDLDIFGPLPVFFQRSYDSSLGDDGVVQSALGDNWQHNYDLRLTIDGTTATVTYHRGRILRFENEGSAWNLAERTDIGFQLVAQGAEFRLADPRSQLMYIFEAQGLLIRIEDGRGNVLTLSYAGNLLQTVGDGLGRTLTFAYDANDLLTSISDGTRTIQLGHTGRNLTTATDPNGKATTYAYDPGNPHSSALMTSRTLPEGNTPFTQIYDTEGRVISQTSADSHTTTFAYSQDVDAYLTIMTDPLGDVLTHIYNPEGELIHVIDQAGMAIGVATDSDGRRNRVTDRHGENTLLTYDPDTGLPTRIRHSGIGNDDLTYTPRMKSGIEFHDLTDRNYPDGHNDQFAYDADGNLTAFTLRDSETFAYTHNPRGQLETATNPTGGIATFTYDANGRLASATDSDPFTGTATYHYDALHRLTGVTHPDSEIFGFSYDVLNRLTDVTDERSNVTTFAYDDNSRLTEITDPFLETITYEYDDRDRVERIVNRLGQDTLLAYEERGLPTAVTDRNGNTTSFQYDERQRLAAATNPASQTTTLHRDEEGRLTAVTNPLGETVTFDRDQMGYLRAVTDPLGNTLQIGRDAMKRVTSFTDPLDRRLNYLYTPRGQLSSAAIEFTGESALRADYTYTALGNLSNIRDPLFRNWRFAYTPVGRLESTTDPLLRTTNYTYDSRGRSDLATFADGVTLDPDYDASSNVTRLLFSDGTDLPYTYDALDRLLTADGLAFTYDAEGRITNTQSSGLDFSATYDPGGRLTSITCPDPGGLGGPVTVTYSYDTRDRLVSAGDDLTGTTLTFAYDDANRLTGITRPNDVSATYTYDPAGRLTRIQEGAIIDLRYTFDTAGQIIETDFATLPLDPATALTSESDSFAYDFAAQLDGPGYTYDERGRLTATPASSYSWDGPSRLTSSDAVDYTYNGLGDVVTRTEGGSTQGFFYNAALGLRPIVAERDEGSGQFQRFHVWSPGGLLLYQIEFPGNVVRFPHFDQVGSTLALTDAAGAVTDAYAYDPYGRLLGHTGGSTQSFQFNGRIGVRSDGALLHMGARWYDPDSARFLTKEPLWPIGELPQMINPYQFALQAPLTFADPAGTSPEPVGTFGRVFGDRSVSNPIELVGEYPALFQALFMLGNRCESRELSDDLTVHEGHGPTEILEILEQIDQKARTRFRQKLSFGAIMLIVTSGDFAGKDELTLYSESPLRGGLPSAPGGGSAPFGRGLAFSPAGQSAAAPVLALGQDALLVQCAQSPPPATQSGGTGASASSLVYKPGSGALATQSAAPDASPRAHKENSAEKMRLRNLKNKLFHFKRISSAGGGPDALGLFRLGFGLGHFPEGNRPFFPSNP